MIVVRILIWVFLGAVAMLSLVALAACVYLLVTLVPLAKKERILREHGYTYEREYFSNGNVSLPAEWVQRMSVEHLETYLLARAAEEARK